MLIANERKEPMNIPKLSETTTDTTYLGRRDAFHVPGVLVKSPEGLEPGDTVDFVDAEFTLVKKSITNFPCAIVDPFINYYYISPGTLFWVFICPEYLDGSVTHNFTIKRKINEEVKINEDDGCRGCYGEVELEEAYADDSCKGCYE